jgi:hypothetical protein
MSRTLYGAVAGVLVGLGEDTLLTTRQTEIQVTFAGVEGDRHAGITRLSDGRTPHYPRGTEIRNSRQVSIVSVEELGVIAADLGVAEVLPEWLGANIVLRDIPSLTDLPPSTRLYFPEDATLVVEGENLPCPAPGKVMQDSHPDVPNLSARFVKAALHRRGIVAWVERPGIIRVGDRIQVEIP